MDPVVDKNPNQSGEGYSTQLHALTSVNEVIDTYLVGVKGFVKHQLVIGRPGTGKASILLISLLYALTKGLFRFLSVKRKSGIYWRRTPASINLSYR